MKRGYFLLLFTILSILLLAFISYIYHASQESRTQLFKPYDLFLIIDYLPRVIQSDSSQIEYFWRQLTLYLNDLLTNNKITDIEYGNILSNFYSASSFLLLLIQQGIVDWDVYSNCFFYKKDIPFCKNI
jgi:hypothetical protein